jgi:tetratricopeptide (TPR) repeat protein
MAFPDKPAAVRPRGCAASGALAHALCLALLSLGGCNQMVTPSSTQTIKDGDRRAADGDYLHAINLYESALDGSAASAEIHYKLALLYDDKLKDPLSALHHFKRYLTVAPGGSRATDVKEFMKRGELALVTSMSGDAVVTRGEAARLKNENLNLRKELEERTAQLRAAAPATDKKGRGGRDEQVAAKAPKASPRSHVVQPGDTLFSLSRLYYNSPSKWKAILDANEKSIDDPGQLKVGQTLVIP